MINAANLVTFCNLLAGLLSISLTLSGRWVEGSWLVLLGCFLDGFDGKLAKWLGQETRFGLFFDTFADFISLGVAPALSVSVGMGLGAMAWIAAFFYVAAAAFRLARFYLESVGGSTTGKDLYFAGLPITSAAAFVASASLLFIDPGLPSLACSLALSVAAALMASRFRFANPKYIPLRPFLPKIVLSAAMAIGVALLTWKLSAAPFLLAVCYLLFGRPGRSQDGCYKPAFR